MTNPNQRLPGESFDHYQTRRWEENQMEKIKNRQHPIVVWDPQATMVRGKMVPYVRAKHGPLTGETVKPRRKDAPPGR